MSSYFFDKEKPYGWILGIGKVFDPENLMSRLALGKQALLSYRPSIFGTSIIMSLDTDSYFVVDNSYIKAFLQYGILYFICSLFVLSMVNYVLYKRKDYFSLFMLSIVAGLGFLEAQIVEIQYNVFPLIVFTCDIGCLALRKDTAYNSNLKQMCHAITGDE